MNRFFASARLAFSMLMASAFCPGFAVPASAQRPLPITEEFKPIPSGPGIQICEPVATGSDAALADFGSGCGLWLQWSMGFQPELGQTPHWDSANRVHEELHVPRLRLSPTQGGRLYSILGVTHVAVGQISGTPTKCLLTYQLYAVPAQKAIGAPIQLTGAEAQVMAQLPQAARTLLADLGVVKPHVPASVGATPAELTTVGHYPWFEDQKPTDAEQQQIDALGKRFPLASFLSFSHSMGTTAKAREDTARRLLEQTSGNFLVTGAVASRLGSTTDAFSHFMNDQVAAFGATNNMVLACWIPMLRITPEDQVRTGQKLVRLAPHSAAAWHILATAYGGLGDSMRNGRFIDAISPQEFETLNGIYSHWVQAAIQTTTIDPDDQQAWVELATAATFAGDGKRADAAFWKAYALDKSEVKVYNWGLEMYQPKWEGDPATLAKVARLAMEAPFLPDTDFKSLASELQSAGFTAEARAMFARALVQARAAARLHPNDSDAHATLGAYLSDQQQYGEAEPELKTAVQLNPDSEAARYELGKLYQISNRLPEAAVQYREDVRLTSGPGHLPGDSYLAKMGLAEVLSYSTTDGHYEESEKLLNELLKLDPKAYRIYADLGWIMNRRGLYEAAVDLFKTALRFDPGGSFAHQELGRAYRLLSKFDDAVREGQFAVSRDPRGYYALAELAETFAAKGDNDTSLKLQKQAVAAAPTFAQAYFDLGKLYLKRGEKQEARAELQHALQMNPTPNLKKSTQDLLDKNP